MGDRKQRHLLAFNLCHDLERYFNAFDVPAHVDSDAIQRNPSNAIAQGLEQLCSVGVISAAELQAHDGQWDWGKQTLSEVIEDEDQLAEIRVLLRCLKDWHNRYTERRK